MYGKLQQEKGDYMQNPSRIGKPKLRNPINKGRKDKGNEPYLRFRKRLRKGMW